MSTSPYSEDLRGKVIKFIESGNSHKLAAGIFNLNALTVSRWWLRYQKEGHYQARIRIGKKPRINAQQVSMYIQVNPNFNALDMGKHFGMTSAGALYWLKKLGYSYKKKPTAMWKQARSKQKPI